MYPIVKGALKSAIDGAQYMQIPMVFVPAFGVSSITSENKMRPAEAIEMVERVNEENFSIFYDSYNYFYEKGWDQLEILKELYPYLGPQLHVKNGRKILSRLMYMNFSEKTWRFCGMRQGMRERLEML